MDLDLSMFRAYDVRVPAAALTPDLAARLAHAEATYIRDELGAPGVVVAHDARATGPRYLTIASDIFQQAGLRVMHLPGASSASLFYFTAMQHPECAGVMFGASHNPAGDTGQKLLAPGVRPIARDIGPAGGLSRIQELYIAGTRAPVRGGGRRVALDNMGDYVAYSLDLAGVRPGSLTDVRVLHDYLSGSGGREMMLGLAAAGADLRALHYTPDGSFPLGDPNPVKPDVIAEGMEELRGGGFLLASFFDGDADRVDFYAGDGRYLSSSFVYAAILPLILARLDGGAGIVFADLKSNPLAVVEMARAGATVQVIRNGHSQIKAAMFDDARVVGAVEESAHFYEAFRYGGQGPYCTENTLYFTLLVTRAWHENQRRFEELLALQGQSSREREWGHYFPGGVARSSALDAVRAHFESQGAIATERTSSGLALEATLMRRGLPFDIGRDTRLEPDWLQVCQRISQSENDLARWEVVAATGDIAASAKSDILGIVGRFGGSEPYQG